MHPGKYQDGQLRTFQRRVKQWPALGALVIVTLIVEATGREFIIDVVHVDGAANIPMLLDCVFVESKPYDFDTPPEYDGDISTYLVSAMQINRFCMNRHDGYVNGIFLDFSVRKVGLKQLWTFKWHQSFNINGTWTIAGGVQPSDWPEWMRGFRDY